MSGPYSADLAVLLRHAFLSGRGVNMDAGGKLSNDDLSAWVGYGALAVPAYQRITDIITLQEAKAKDRLSIPVAALLVEIVDELTRAREKFPGTNCTLAALMEEVGEVSTALMEEPRAHVRKEAVQVAVVAMRIVLDGDQTLDEWRKSKGLDPLVI